MNRSALQCFGKCFSRGWGRVTREGRTDSWRRSCCAEFFLQQGLKCADKCPSTLVDTVLVAAPLCVMVVLLLVLPLDACAIHGHRGHQALRLVTAAAEARLGEGTDPD